MGFSSLLPSMCRVEHSLLKTCLLFYFEEQQQRTECKNISSRGWVCRLWHFFFSPHHISFIKSLVHFGRSNLIRGQDSCYVQERGGDRCWRCWGLHLSSSSSRSSSSSSSTRFFFLLFFFILKERNKEKLLLLLNIFPGNSAICIVVRTRYHLTRLIMDLKVGV